MFRLRCCSLLHRVRLTVYINVSEEDVTSSSGLKWNSMMMLSEYMGIFHGRGSPRPKRCGEYEPNRGQKEWRRRNCKKTNVKNNTVRMSTGFSWARCDPMASSWGHSNGPLNSGDFLQDLRDYLLLQKEYTTTVPHNRFCSSHAIFLLDSPVQ